MLGVGACFWAGGGALLLVIPLLALNWFGDSLDGTLARVRNQERPRYGYYVDHVLDAVGFAVLFGGLMLGGHMSLVVRTRVPGGLLPAGGRDLAGDARARHVQDGLHEGRPDRAAHPAGRRARCS